MVDAGWKTVDTFAMMAAGSKDDGVEIMRSQSRGKNV